MPKYLNLSASVVVKSKDIMDTGTPPKEEERKEEDTNEQQ